MANSGVSMECVERCPNAASWVSGGEELETGWTLIFVSDSGSSSQTNLFGISLRENVYLLILMEDVKVEVSLVMVGAQDSVDR